MSVTLDMISPNRDAYWESLFHFHKRFLLFIAFFIGSMSMSTKFFNLFKRRGFGETLQLLSTFENHEVLQSTFIAQINAGDSYYNAFLRVRKDLHDAGLIKFKLNDENQKMIYLTEKGKLLIDKIGDIEQML